jgi:hypothetical protein
VCSGVISLQYAIEFASQQYVGRGESQEEGYVVVEENLPF